MYSGALLLQAFSDQGLVKILSGLNPRRPNLTWAALLPRSVWDMLKNNPIFSEDRNALGDLSQDLFRDIFFWGVIDVDIIFLSCLDSNHQCEDKSDRRGKLLRGANAV